MNNLVRYFRFTYHIINLLYFLSKNTLKNKKINKETAMPTYIVIENFKRGKNKVPNTIS